jgi:hypothetical protein
MVNQELSMELVKTKAEKVTKQKYQEVLFLAQF